MRVVTEKRPIPYVKRCPDSPFLQTEGSIHGCRLRRGVVFGGTEVLTVGAVIQPVLLSFQSFDQGVHGCLNACRPDGVERLPKP